MNKPKASGFSEFIGICTNTLWGYWQYAKHSIGKRLGPKIPPPTRKHLLLLAWEFAPTVSGGVYRPLSFVQHAVSQGWQVTVVASVPTGPIGEAGAHLAAQIPASVKVIRVAPSTRQVSHVAFPRIDGGFLNIFGILDAVREQLSMLPSVVVASGPPFHTFVAAWFLSKTYKAPLVLDYRDEWTECPFPFVNTGNVDVKWERQCLKDAATVLMTTNSFIENAAGKFPEFRRESVVKIMNGWEPADFPVAAGNATHTSKVLRAAYLGALGKHTPLNGFFADMLGVLSFNPCLAKDLPFHFIGKKTAHARQELAAHQNNFNIHLVDQVPKPVAIALMQQSALLLLINEPSLSRYIPGKLFDYISAFTPILVYGEGGEVATIVSGLKAGIVVRAGDPEALAHAIESILNGSFRIDADIITTWLREHTRESSAQLMLETLQRVIDR
ncbi:glycosyltransferase [Pseudorhodoferax sp.]|uniref:glycosyltransferase n=1 Tax=Pseudorhodoferax sp. TaxID=1993553 RepID=UPI002DD67267|nr:glycosyltransferase [Pseudorhodoferax sp.]